jgi:hypothetical protein
MMVVPMVTLQQQIFHFVSHIKGQLSAPITKRIWSLLGVIKHIQGALLSKDFIIIIPDGN